MNKAFLPPCLGYTQEQEKFFGSQIGKENVTGDLEKQNGHIFCKIFLKKISYNEKHGDALKQEKKGTSEDKAVYHEHREKGKQLIIFWKL